MRRPERSHLFLFQYGSNMSPDRLNGSKRLNGLATAIAAAKLDGWGIRFDLYSETNQSAVTDIVPAPGEYVMGILFEIPRAALDTMDNIEGVRGDGTGNYQRADAEVTVIPDGVTVAAITYIGTESGRERFRKQPAERHAVKSDYFEHLLAGARQFAFSRDYVAYLRRQAGRCVN
jgi:gamma-glutamylcyclotransferase (GGCT)/AIG2-like uncharacterized protein YtfP